MAKGIIYVMSTVVPGLIKIGKTQSNQFENRMYNLERNGYNNVVGLHREFAIEVDDYDEKESMLDDIFSKSRLHNSELFSLNLDMVVQLLSSFEGKQVYPAVESKEETFQKAAADRAEFVATLSVPDGTYYMERALEKMGGVAIKAQMDVDEGNFIIRAGQKVCTIEGPGLSRDAKEARLANIDSDGRVVQDVYFDTPSGAGMFVIGSSCNGWKTWKTKSGQWIDVFRRNA